MAARLVALDEGPDIQLDRAMLVVGRHPQCDARLDSIRVSRQHCCMTQGQNGELVVRDLNSTNGIRINGQRVSEGRLKPGDELSIAHIRYRLEDGQGQEVTLAGPLPERENGFHPSPLFPHPRHGPPAPPGGSGSDENPLAAAVRDMLPPAMADRCRIQVIVQMQPEGHEAAAEAQESCQPGSSPS
ncbi:MAG TPA: FHA domain-containing protein [Isosphaeraceae bacterium]|jgi:hypothetical protein|nr:FHA domain-containing protein [Isosphaeraceae bacterium]